MGAIADMVIEIYAMESAVLRTQKIVAAARRVRRSAADRHDARLSVAGAWRKSKPPREKSSPPLPKATCCARSWRFCGAWQSTNHSTPLSCASRLLRKTIEAGKYRLN